MRALEAVNAIEQFKGSRGWLIVLEHLRAKLSDLRASNDSEMDLVALYRNQGRIAEVKELIGFPEALINVLSATELGPEPEIEFGSSEEESSNER